MHLIAVGCSSRPQQQLVLPTVCVKYACRVQDVLSLPVRAVKILKFDFQFASRTTAVHCWHTIAKIVHHGPATACVSKLQAYPCKDNASTSMQVSLRMLAIAPLPTWIAFFPSYRLAANEHVQPFIITSLNWASSVKSQWQSPARAAADALSLTDTWCCRVTRLREPAGRLHQQSGCHHKPAACQANRLDHHSKSALRLQALQHAAHIPAASDTADVPLPSGRQREEAFDKVCQLPGRDTADREAPNSKLIRGKPPIPAQFMLEIYQ